MVHISSHAFTVLQFCRNLILHLFAYPTSDFIFGHEELLYISNNKAYNKYLELGLYNYKNDIELHMFCL